MPNWCYNHITLENNDSKELEKLNKLIEEWVSKEACENGFHKWLGNVAVNAGLIKVEDINADHGYLIRGEINEIDADDKSITLNTESAWEPSIKMWLDICKKYSPDTEVIYSSKECGCGLYYTNDSDLEDKFMIDPWDLEKIEYQYDADAEYVVKILKNLLNTDEDELTKLMATFEKSEVSEKMAIHKWEYVPAEDLN